jgi:inorganic pyrophosphatase
MLINAIPIGTNRPAGINVVVKVPIGGEPIKYELDKASGALFVNRMLYTAMRYPGNYGFVPQLPNPKHRERLAWLMPFQTRLA